MVAVERTDLNENGIYDSIGGWLVLPAILHPLFAIGYCAFGAFEAFKLFSDTLPFESQVFILTISLSTVALGIGWLGALYYACTISPIFPKFYIWLTIISIVLPITALWYSHIRYGTKASPEDYKDISQAILLACIWIPYMLVSKRVKATFYGVPIKRRTEATRPLPASAAPELAADDLSPAARLRRKGHRLGIFLTVVSIPVLLIGLLNSGSYEQPAWASLFTATGFFGLLCGYLFARLWYWFKAA